MKKIFIPLFAVLALTGACDRTIEGKVVGERRSDPSYGRQVMPSIPKGHEYTIRDKSGGLWLAYSSSDVLNVGDRGSFRLGEELFRGSFDVRESDQLVNEHLSGYELEGFDLD